ncbi:unnamed protein product [Mycena citricolor]|uniref:Uncharacterized protein n=1 Tax=Mycena citricolor TaxID=2018698 RepID=A0AAD2JV91_9AGAR|nr:unnamed protein product [Mycena citricolor]
MQALLIFDIATSLRLDDVMHQSNRQEGIPLPIGTVHDLTLLTLNLSFRALADMRTPFPAAHNPNAAETGQHAGCSELYRFALTTASLTLKPVLEAQYRTFGYLWTVCETGTRRE